MDTGASPLYRPLPKPPTAAALTVRKLVGRVHEGGVRVPHFQRPLRWGASDVVKLFDSILKGYPIGSLLFWKHGFASDPDLRIGGARVSVPATADGWAIVDGQQRITSLAAALLDLDHAGDTRWVVRFDPVAGSFLSGEPDVTEVGRHVPLSVLGDLRRLGRWFNRCSLSEEEQALVEEVQQRVLDYELGCSVIEGEDVAGLEGAFARMNSTGVRMRAEEVFQALFGTKTRAVAERVELAALQRAADVDGFGEPPRGEVLKAVLSMSGLDPLKRVDDLAEGELTTVISEADAADAIRRAAEFVQAPVDAAEPGAGIPVYAFVPYPAVFPLLARWFYLYPSTDAATRRALAVWLWRGVITGSHLRGAKSALRFQVKNMVEDDQMGSLARLMKAMGTPESAEWSLQPFKGNHAASRVEILALLSLRPRYTAGDPVSIRALLTGGRVAREVFRVDRFDKGDDRELARTAANRILLDSRRTDIQSDLRRWHSGIDADALESHLIDEATFHALCEGRSRDFLVRRASRLRTLVSSFLTRRAELDGPLVLPRGVYLDEEPAAETGP